MKKIVFAVVALLFTTLLPQAGQTVGHAAPVRFGRSKGTTGTTNWTGYDLLSKDNKNDYFTEVDGAWTVLDVPSVFSPDGGKLLSEISSWVGLGGDTINNPRSNVLWQAGETYYTTCFNDSCHKYSFWYEDFGCNGGSPGNSDGPAPCPNGGWPVFVNYPTMNPGDRVYVRVKVNGQVTFKNLTNGESYTYHVSIDNNNVGRSAEWITELTCSYGLTGGCSPLPFGDPRFSDAYAYGTRESTYLDIFNYRRFTLGNQQNSVLAAPTTLNRLTHGFSVTCCAV